MSLKEVNLFCNANTKNDYLKYFFDVKAQVNSQRDNSSSSDFLFEPI